MTTIYDNANVCYIETENLITDQIDYQFSKQHPQWTEAMTEEFESLVKNNTWNLVDLPPGRRAISSKWTYKVTPTARPTYNRLKACLVARGLEQRHDIDYNDTFAPVVRWSILRTIIALAIALDWPIKHLDVVTAFLNGFLKEDIYMQQPRGYEVARKEDLVCKLRRRIYGLKQSSEEWYHKIDSHLCAIGWCQSNADPNLCYLSEDTTITMLLLYVDDLFLVVNITPKINKIKRLLQTKYEMKDLDPITRAI